MSNFDTEIGEKTYISSASDTSLENSPIPFSSNPTPNNDVLIQDEITKPNLFRFALRAWQSIASIGAFGFQIGATPYSNRPVPFEDLSLLYYGYIVCWLSFIWSSFHLFVYLTRRFGSGKKIKRFLSGLFDSFLTALFGVCVFYEISLYKCKPGLHNGWCDFYNTSLFFLMSLFVSYVIHSLWDIFGALSCLRK